MGWLDNWRKVDQTLLEVSTGFVDLSLNAVVVCSSSPRHERYAKILTDFVRKKARVDWNVHAGEFETHAHVNEIRLVLNEELENLVGREGYVISMETRADSVSISLSGVTDRSLLFAVGRLLREMTLDYHISYAKELKSLCCIRQGLRIVSKPDYRMRQHQIAYRPKTNSYDAFTPEMMRQEVLELALFGTNGVEMIPPGVDDALQSPNFSIPWLDMLRTVSQWCEDLDLNVSMWYPAFFKEYTDPEVYEAHWRLIFGSMPRLDVLFVPGGDPGGRKASELFQVVEMQAKFMREHFFPNCEVWVSSQYGLSVSVDLGLPEPWVPLVQEQQWFDCVKTPRVRSFLNGVVYGPWSCVPLREFRAQLPADLPLRNYPDLCHVQTAEMPISTWDLCFPVTNGRESINPRPKEMAAIIQDDAPNTIGCGCYSEGVNDDINKYVWTSLHWGDDIEGPLMGASVDVQLTAMLTQYASFLMEQPRSADRIVEGIYTLERNWRGDLLTSKSIIKSQQIFLEIQNQLVPRHRKNWRLNMLLFRATHDAFLYTRLCQERAAEEKAISFVLTHPDMTYDTLKTARGFLAVPYNEPPITMSSFNSPSTPDALNITKLTGAPSITHLYGQLMALAAALYHQIGYQLSVGYGGQHRQRGAYFDLIWAPLGDVVYLNNIFALVQDHELSQLNGRDLAIVNRFQVSLMERLGRSPNKVLWYASFGDENANELPGSTEPPTRPIPVHKVLPPYRPLRVGEDPVYFTRPLTEYLDASNDTIIKELHDGMIPRCFRSWIEPIVPRTSRFDMNFQLSRLLPGVPLEQVVNELQLSIRITYLGADINRHGGDWEELDRVSMPVRLFANGVLVHDYLAPPQITEIREFTLNRQIIQEAVEAENLIFTFEPKLSTKVTFREVPIPIAEMWILQRQDTIAKL